MRPLLSTSQSLELDASTRAMFDFSSDNLMEIAAMRLWHVLKREVIQKRLAHLSPAQASIVALCGKGDNAGDALAVLRHARLDGFHRLSAIVPGVDTMKENARLNLRRAERCGIEIIQYESAEAPALLEMLSRQDIVLDAVLGTGVHGPAKGTAAGAIQVLRSLASGRTGSVDRTPWIVAVDIPSGLGDDWQSDYPIVHADATLCIEPAKEALYMPAARPYAGDILPVGGIFPLWTEGARSLVWLLEADDIGRFVPPISRWAHKMQRGRVAVLAGSRSGAGAALHCVRGAAAAGAGYIGLYCDEELFSSYLAAAGDLAIVRVLSQESFSPESWDAIVVGPGWGTDDGRRGVLERLLSADTALVLDADAVRLFAKIAGKAPSGFFKAPIILTPHPGEFRDLAALFGQAQADQARNASETVRQSVALAQEFGLVLALRASTTHVAFPDGSCAVFDGSASGLGIAGSGDVLSGLAGGLLARWIALSREPGAAGFGEDAALFHTPLARAILGAVLVHGIAGRRLSATKGWFTPADLAQACVPLTSGSEHG